MSDDTLINDQIADPDEGMKRYLAEVKAFNEKAERDAHYQNLQLQKQRELQEEQSIIQLEKSKEKALEAYIPDEVAIHRAQNGWVLHHTQHSKEGEFKLDPNHEVYYTAEELLKRLQTVFVKQIELDKAKNGN